MKQIEASFLKAGFIASSQNYCLNSIEIVNKIVYLPENPGSSYYSFSRDYTASPCH